MTRRLVGVTLCALIGVACSDDGSSPASNLGVETGGGVNAAGAGGGMPPASGGTASGGGAATAGGGGAPTGSGGTVPGGGGAPTGSGGIAAGSGGETSGGGGTSPGAGGSGAQDPSSGSSVSIDGSLIRATINARDVPAGSEEHVCVVVHLPNETPIQVTEVRAVLSEGSHHLIVDRRAAGTAEQPEPVVCAPTMGDQSRLIIGQQKDARITLPSPSAYNLEARQPVFLQLHYINTTTEAHDIEGAVELTIAPPGADLVEAKSLFTGSISINIPPNSPGTAEHFQIVAPTEGAVRHAFAMTSHTHSLGVRATIERVPNAGAPPTQPLHESLDWAEPPLTTFGTPLEFDGTDGVRLRCEYQNDTDRTIHFGSGFYDEMCFMWLYYFDL